MTFQTTSRPEIFLVASESEANVWYRLILHAGAIVCSCPGFTFRGRCKHAAQMASIFPCEPPPVAPARIPFPNLIPEAA